MPRTLRADDLRPISARGPFHTYAGTSGGERIVAIVASERLARAEAAEALAAMAAAHAAADHPRVPAPLGRCRIEGAEALLLRSQAVLDLATALEGTAALGRKVPYRAAAAFITGLHELLEARAVPGISTRSILIDDDGQWEFVGLGRGVFVDPTSGMSVEGVVAPEVAAGAPPDTRSNTWVGSSFLRSLIGYVALHPRVAAALRGEVDRADALVMSGLIFANLRVLGALPHDRPHPKDGLREFQRVWAHLGVEPDEALLAATMRELVSSEHVADAAEDLHAGTHWIAEDGSWVEPGDGSRHVLRSRSALRRVLASLVTDLRTVRVGLDLQAILAVGWPGERPLPEAGANRVYVALSHLRKAGLDTVLERRDSRWRLSPRAPITLVAP